MVESISAGPDIVGMYLREIKQYALLTRPQEVEAAREIERREDNLDALLCESAYFRESLKEKAELILDTEAGTSRIFRMIYCEDAGKEPQDEKHYLTQLARAECPEEMLDALRTLRLRGEVRADFTRDLLAKLKSYRQAAIDRSDEADILEEKLMLTPQQAGDYSARVEGAYSALQAARERMINSNLQRVVSIAKRYRRNGLPFLDLVQEGNLGLMKAVDMFQHRRGYRFSTYSTYWVMQQVIRAVQNHSRTIRLPLHMNERMLDVRRMAWYLLHELKKEPTPEEIAEALGMTAQQVKDVLSIRPTASLDEMVPYLECTRRIDLVPDPDSPDPEIYAIREHGRSGIAEFIDFLDPHSRRILKLRFGLSGEEPHTLEEVAAVTLPRKNGRRCRVGREAIRQIEEKSLKRLGHPSRRERVRELLEQCAS